MSEIDRAVECLAQGLPSLRCHGTHGIGYLCHTQSSRRSYTERVRAVWTLPCGPRGREEGWHTGSHAHGLGSTHTHNTGDKDVFQSPKTDQSSSSQARLRRQRSKVVCEDWNSLILQGPLGLRLKEKLLVGESRKGFFTEYEDKYITGL